MAVRGYLKGSQLTTCTMYGGNYSSGVPSWGSAIALAGTSLLDGVGFSYSQGLIQVNGIDDLYAHNIKTIIDIRAFLNLYTATDSATLGQAIMTTVASYDLVKLVVAFPLNGATIRTCTYIGIWDDASTGVEQIGANMSRVNLRPINNANVSPLTVADA